jgi:L-malate glycosyltransferase
MKYRTAVAKKNIELVLMMPLVWAGRLAGNIFKLKTNHSIFIFFSNADVGGAMKVNADIVECVKEKNPLVIFAKKPLNNEFKFLFENTSARLLFLDKYLDNKFYHFVNIFFRGVFATWINKTAEPLIFGGECLYFYKVIPHVKKATKIIELCHVNRWINFTQAFVKYIDKRIFSTQQIKRDVEQQYKTNGVPDKYLNRLFFIDNKIDIPDFKKVINKKIEVLYVGRDGPQKRVYLIAETARQLHTLDSNIHFSFVGDVEASVPKEVQQYCSMYGIVKDKEKLNSIYEKSDVLILTSAFEGLPIVVMDMMARGKIVLSTAVSGIPDYITHMETGMLIFEKGESEIIKEAITLLQKIEGNRNLLDEIGNRCYTFASARFSAAAFDSFYKSVLFYDKFQ